ncbi:DNA polymerase III subunit gamma/tau [Pseudoxanthomonas sacheonensis]|uniref:DNA polymerase III subunit gamma/tau n=1 Tax=Pseudoxanthomonas sacheonensis TaxID=443615 RepID=A0ABU1RVF2_9GAMM|nr:DNA polymerase III subunit gamma/tau [Pseudoxanthomonas sacheonensis]MDR6842265.1 DNA polymerase-3 subunit gamma/tau [Pseudoxanthomonas sacheonensis]
MSYLVLARKWRPKRFSELVGQEHVVRALTNALESGRVHHAFLFTGTRGVGKTTIARIFAKSLNCEEGTSAEPCGKCSTCLDIDSGRYLDLLEIDAASNTGVDDVREVIENAQYMPSRGKFKVYLIDEVHMLSKAAFNALLKTLEEPPEHVKFLLATTDPQKLPVTVLSRCLQFNLKRLDEDQISGQIDRILAAEQIQADPSAIRQIAKAADGSLRDGLSLLDQAIAYTGSGNGGALREEGIRTMLGTVDRTQVGAMLDALAHGDGARLLQIVAALAEFSPDWNGVLDALAEALHRIQVRQLVPGVSVEADGIDADDFAQRLRPEVVQLWYQMAVNGRRDLHLAPSTRAGFEMSVLRMLAFRPAGAGQVNAGQAGSEATKSSPAISAIAAPPPPAPATAKQETPAPAGKPVVEALVAPVVKAQPQPGPAAAASVVVSAAESESVAAIATAEDWLHFAGNSGMKGAARQLAENAAFVGYGEGVLRLSLDAGFDYLRSEKSLAELSNTLAGKFGAAPRIVFDHALGESETLQQRSHRERSIRQSADEENFMNNPDVQRLIQQHGAKLVPDSIRPFDE